MGWTSENENGFAENRDENWGGEMRMVREGLDAIRYVLPKRSLGKLRRLGWVPIAFGLFMTVFMFFWMWGPISSSLGQQGVGRWLGIGFGLLGLPGLAIGIGIMALGVAILANASHTEILLGGGSVCAVERFGWLSLRRRRPIRDVKRLVVQTGGIKVTDSRGMERKVAEDLAGLTAELGNGRKFPLVVAYPAGVVRELAARISAELPSAMRESVAEDPVPLVQVVERDTTEEAEDVEVPRPAATDILLREEPNGLAISVPAKGLWKGSQGLFFFSLLWNGFMLVFTAAIIRDKPPLPVSLFLLLFWGIGAGLLVGSIHMARRRVMIAIINDVLAYRSTSPIRTEEKRIPLEDVDTFRVGPSGVEVNNRPVMELQIIHRSGGKTGLLSNRTVDEQAWLAWVLRRYAAGRRPAARAAV